MTKDYTIKKVDVLPVRICKPKPLKNKDRYYKLRKKRKFVRSMREDSSDKTVQTQFIPKKIVVACMEPLMTA